MTAAVAVNGADLPDEAAIRAAALEPEVMQAQSVGLLGYVYGYPIVDMLKQMHNETHRVRLDQPVAAPVNRFAVYPGVLTPKTQGQLRGANSDTLYINGWFDLSKGPVLIDVPEMGDRYYTLAFMDLYSKPHHLGTRTNGGKATRYALVGPSGGDVPEGHVRFDLPTDIAWLLGRVLVVDPADEPEGKRLSHAIKVTGEAGPDVCEAAAMNPFDSLLYFTLLNQGLKLLRRQPGEEALMAQFNAAGFGPDCDFDAEALTPGQRLGLGWAVKIGPQVISQRGFRPTQTTNGWMLSSAIADPGMDYLLRAEVVRGGYVNEPEESIYPAAITDDRGEMLTGERCYRIHFDADAMPPVGAFWSITSYDMKTAQLTENPLGRYAIGDRTPGLVYGADGSLDIALSAKPPAEGTSNWLAIPPGAFHLVTRLYLPAPEALDGRYVLPVVERVD
jgi:hypothetical protein